jgi:hypothetical protein
MPKPLIKERRGTTFFPLESSVREWLKAEDAFADSVRDNVSSFIGEVVYLLGRSG